MFSSLLGRVPLLVAVLVVQPGLLQAATDDRARLPSIDVSVRSNCGGVSRAVAPVRAEDRITLDLPPHSEWMGWSREAGADLVIHTTDPHGGGYRALDSAPARYADDPLWLRADGQGRSSLRLQVLGRSHQRSLSIELTCIQSLSEAERTRMQAAFDLAHHMHTWFEQGGQDRLVSWLKAFAGLLVEVELDPRTRLWLDFQLATAARRGGFLLEAHGWFSRALAGAEALQRDEMAVLAELGLGKSDLNLGRATAEARLRKVALQATALGLPYPGLVAAQDLCVLQRLAGRMPEAIACYREAVRQSESLGEWADFANAQSNLALALVSQGDLNGARQALDASLQAADRQGSSRVRWSAARLLAQVHGWSGQYIEALAVLDETLRTLGRNRPVERGQLLATLAGTYTLMGELRRALGIYEDVIADMHTRGQSVRAQLLTLRAAETELRLGLPAGAASRLQDWLNSEPSDSVGDAVRQGRLILASALADLGDMQGARNEYAKIGHRSEDWGWSRRLRALDLELRFGLHADVELPLARAATEALAQRHDMAHVEAVALALRYPRQDDPDAAFAWFEPAAAERLRNAARVVRSPELRGGLVARLRPLANHAALQARSGTIDAARVRAALEPIEELRAIEQQRAEATDENALAMLERSVAIDALNGESGTGSGRDTMTALAWHASLVTEPGKPLPSSGIELPELAADEILLYPVLDEHRASLFVAQGGQWQVIVGIDAAELRRASVDLLRGLEAGRMARAQLDAKLAAVRHAIGWQQVRVDRPFRRLLVVAESALGALPWELLAAPPPGAPGGEALPELVFLQSLRPARPQLGFDHVLALGPEQADSGAMPALPAAATGPDRIVRLWGDQAPARRVANSSSDLMRALHTANALVHVAGHAQAGDGLSEDAGLWLGTSQQPEFVSALRLAQAHTVAGLVVLNACETGRSYTHGLIGLGGAAGSLVNGGARQVIATRWPVGDLVARRFAILLHEQLSQSTAPARALRAAQDALRAQPTHRHPSDWAAWFLLQSGPSRD